MFLDTLKAAKDKNGRTFAHHFQRLPDPRQDPGFYEVIRMPISIEDIEVSGANIYY
jgi:hypothetical protein